MIRKPTLKLNKSGLRLGQSAIEYLVASTVILAVIAFSGVLPRIQEAFSQYFDNAVSYME